MSLNRNVCPILVNFDKSSPKLENEIKDRLEHGDIREKRDALRKALKIVLNGDPFPQLFITVIRYVLPSEDHAIQKLLLIYMEMMNRATPDGKLIPEMILLCQNIRNNLMHPNEFMRGCTLRFLSRISEVELLEPLVPSILSNLEHRHSFVRRNAALAIHSVYRLPGGQVLVPDAAERLEVFLKKESDPCAQRNAFYMLFSSAQDKAVSFLLDRLDGIAQMGDVMQMATLASIKDVCNSRPAEKASYIKLILTLLSSPNAAVVYECAGTLCRLSTAPSAIRAAADCYCQLLVSQSDNNVKLIVLDRISELKVEHPELLQEMVMDVLRALSSQVIDVRRKALSIAMDLITSKNVLDVLTQLKKEITRVRASVASSSFGDDGQQKEMLLYCQLLIHSIQSCTADFPEVIEFVVPILLEFVSDKNFSVGLGLDCMNAIREMVETNASVISTVTSHLQNCLHDIRSATVAGSALWILGEYVSQGKQVVETIKSIRDALGSIDSIQREALSTLQLDPSRVTVTKERAVVLSDGTYAQAPDRTTDLETGTSSSTISSLQKIVASGDFCFGAILCMTLLKLVLRLRDSQGSSSREYNSVVAEVLLICTNVLNVTHRTPSARAIDSSSKAHIFFVIRTLAFGGGSRLRVDGEPEEEDINIRISSLLKCRKNYANILHEEKALQKKKELEDTSAMIQPDVLMDISSLKRSQESTVSASSLSGDLSIATSDGGVHGLLASKNSVIAGHSLNRLIQLTGFSDAIYAEAFVTVQQYDVVLEMTLINRTDKALQNVSVELATVGDLKLIDKPAIFSLGAKMKQVLTSTIKVSSTETGVIFGNIVYEKVVGRASVIILNDVHIDIMDYIQPASCVDAKFRSMWAEFEWENKVSINTSLDDPRKYLKHIMSLTNMNLLGKGGSLEGDCGVLGANLYARSLFCEDALVNLSVEVMQNGKLSGYIRIRSKTQGIALSLGDKITVMQS